MKNLCGFSQDFVLGLAVSALAAVEQPITVASAKTADVANPFFRFDTALDPTPRSSVQDDNDPFLERFWLEATSLETSPVQNKLSDDIPASQRPAWLPRKPLCDYDSSLDFTPGPVFASLIFNVCRYFHQP